MKTFETVAVVASDGSLKVPVKMRRRLSPNQRVKLLVVVADAEDGGENAAWQALTYDQFLSGYAEADAVYDKE